MKRALPILLALAIALSVIPPGLAADGPAGSLVFDVSPPDGDGLFDVTMTVYNMNMWGIQTALRFDPKVICPVKENGGTAEQLEDFAKLGQPWMLSFGSVKEGYVEAAVITTLSMSPTEPLNDKGEMEVGEDGLELFTFRFRRLSEGDAALEIATEEKGEPFWADCPTGVLALDGDGEVPIEVTFREKERPKETARTEVFLPTASRQEAPEAEPEPTAEDLLKKLIVLRIGSHAAVVNAGVAALYPGENEVVPYIRNDRTFVPIRFVAERLGAEVDWDNNTQTAIVKKDGHTILMPIGSTAYTVDGEEFEMDAAAELVHDRTMVPIRFISEALGYRVEWEGMNKLVVIIPPELDWNGGGSLENEALNSAIGLMLMFGNFV